MAHELDAIAKSRSRCQHVAAMSHELLSHELMLSHELDAFIAKFALAIRAEILIEFVLFLECLLSLALEECSLGYAGRDIEGPTAVTVTPCHQECLLLLECVLLAFFFLQVEILKVQRQLSLRLVTNF